MLAFWVAWVMKDKHVFGITIARDSFYGFLTLGFMFGFWPVEKLWIAFATLAGASSANAPAPAPPPPVRRPPVSGLRSSLAICPRRFVARPLPHVRSTRRSRTPFVARPLVALHVVY